MAAYEREQDADAELAAVETEDGEFCVYWQSTDENEGPRGRYATLEEAKAVARQSQRRFEEYHPGGSALCGFEVRVLDGETWSEIETRNPCRSRESSANSQDFRSRRACTARSTAR